jgi:hypothetical protein
MAIRERSNNYFVDYEDNGFGGDMFGGYGGGIASLPAAPVPTQAPAPAPAPTPVPTPAPTPVPAQEPDYYARQFAPNIFSPAPVERDPFRQPEQLPVAPPVETPVEFQPSFIETDPFRPPEKLPVAPPVETPVEPSLIGASVPAVAQPEVQNTGVFGLPSLAQTEQAQPEQPSQPVQPAGPAPEIVSSLSQQILGQGLTGKWSGAGHGSAEKNAEDMAKILAGIGITDIKQFGKFTKTGINETVSSDGKGGFVDQRGNPVDPKLVSSQMAGESEGGYYTEYVSPVGSQEVFGNKVTKQEVPNTYSERQQGNFFGGTFAGKGNTGYGVQFDDQGNPYFYTQGASSNSLANLLKDLGPIGQIAIAAATGGLSLPAQLAANAGIQLLAGGNLKDIAKGTALSYLGGQAGNLISGSSGITDLLGKAGSDIAARTAQQFVGSGGKADLEKMLLGNAVSSGINSTIGEIPGLDSLSPVDRNMTSNLISAVATGTPIEQAIQNALVGKASYEASNAVAQARNAPSSSTEQPQTYEQLMAGIEPKTADQPSTSPSNDDILKQIGYEPEPTTVSQEPANLDQLLRSLQPYAEPTQEGRTLPLERPQITQEPTTAQLPFDAEQLLSQLPSQEQSTSAVDNLINKSAEDTLGTKNAAEPATGKGKAMDEIDYSQIGGDFGGNIADLIANAGSSGNASSIFSGDGGIDLSGINWEGTVDAPAPPSNIADLLEKVTTGNEVNESFLSNLSPDELARYRAMQEEGYESPLAGTAPQELGISQAMIDEFNKNYQPRGGFGSQWQTYGSDRIMINDDGTGIGINTDTGNQYALSPKEVQSMIANKMLNTKASGYVGATGGKGSTPGGSRPAASTAKKSTTTAGGKDNTGLIMALMAMMAMMNSKGGGSSAASVIPALSANRSQLPYGSSGGASARPGAGGVNYFSPMNYTAKAAEGGLMGLAGGGMSNLGGYSDGGRLLKGPGDGVSDSIPATIGGKQPARLATGEFVVPARIVSELGNGSTDAGAKKLYAMMDRVQKARRKTKNVAADTKAHKYLPA